MKSNIHPFSHSKVNIYTNGSTYLSSAPLLKKYHLEKQICNLFYVGDDCKTGLFDPFLINASEGTLDLEPRKKNNNKSDAKAIPLDFLKIKIKEQLKKDYFCITSVSNNETTKSVKELNNTYRFSNVRISSVIPKVENENTAVGDC
jgi:hypothetical protein